MNEESWPESVVRKRDLALKIIEERGYGDLEMGSLALLEDGSYKDSDLPAEVVAMARLVLSAEDILQSFPSDDINKDARMAYVFGQIFMHVCAFHSAPGHGAIFAEKLSGLPRLLGLANDYAERGFEAISLRQEGRQKKIEERRESLKPRNEAICAVALTLRLDGVKDPHLPTKVLHYFGWKDLWRDFPREQWIHTEKQVRTILRAGGVISPAKKKNSRKSP